MMEVTKLLLNWPLFIESNYVIKVIIKSFKSNLTSLINKQ